MKIYRKTSLSLASSLKSTLRQKSASRHASPAISPHSTEFTSTHSHVLELLVEFDCVSGLEHLDADVLSDFSWQLTELVLQFFTFSLLLLSLLPVVSQGILKFSILLLLSGYFLAYILYKSVNLLNFLFFHGDFGLLLLDLFLKRLLFFEESLLHLFENTFFFFKFSLELLFFLRLLFE